MAFVRHIAAWVVCVLFGSITLFSADIVNSATLYYKYNNTAFQVQSNTVSDTIVGGGTPPSGDVIVQCALAGPLVVNPGDQDAALKFTIDNTGTVSLTLTLTADVNTTYPVDNPIVYEDTNANGVFDSGDTPTTSVTLASGDTQTVFFVGDIPTSAAWAYSENGITAQDVNSSVVVSDTCVYKIESNTTVPDGELRLTKSARISSHRLYKGSVIYYTIDVVAVGGAVSDVVVNDAIPVGTTYMAGSTRLNGVSLKDETVYKNGKISVSLPDMKKGTTHRITFSVRVNR